MPQQNTIKWRCGTNQIGNKIDKRQKEYNLIGGVSNIVVVIKPSSYNDPVYELGNWVTSSTSGLPVEPLGQMKKLYIYIYIYVIKTNRHMPKLNLQL